MRLALGSSIMVFGIHGDFFQKIASRESPPHQVEGLAKLEIRALFESTFEEACVPRNCRARIHPAKMAEIEK